ncbi:MAG: glutamine--tRNA ligase/YqeY domain fusion protein [Myxococcales bacterium]|jgi:glutaminyl-tRNA synthetase|nr:glutamine--tRNA ligase/YqeY domain fusion protein [Myxococcales bacterium]
MTTPESAEQAPHFIHEIIDEELASQKVGGVVTRFPPEPNGYLHIGHAKAICVNFETAQKYGGRCHLRFDDTNPSKEEQEFIDSIMSDIRWLGFDWGEHLYFASDYFEQLYGWAIQLIRDGKAYVCDLSADEVRAYRGTLTEPGRESPCRNRSIEENLDLFQRMRVGEFPDGAKTLRAKIDMASPNMNLRDPALYRIRRAHHPRVGDAWCIYPMYDWAHGQSDAIEHISHSICTLEFENHRPLYDWFLGQVTVPCKPRQIEFARLNLTYTVMSKRVLRLLVERGLVEGWDDPRMPTIAGLRRRGYTPAAMRAFCERIGLAKRESLVDVTLLENAVRDDLNAHAPRVMGVLSPLKVVIENWDEGKVELLDAPYHPDKPEFGSRSVPFTRELFIERDDFMEEPSKKFFRLAPGKEVRLRWAYFLKCERVVKDEAGNVVELRCTIDPETKGGAPSDGRKVKGTIHWVSATDSIDAEVRLYDRLFKEERPDLDDVAGALNPDSLKVTRARVEKSLASAKAGEHFQFERQGYFFTDPILSKDGAPVFNRVVPLRDTWAKVAAKG